MYKTAFSRTKSFFSRCLKPFQKQESNQDKEFVNCFFQSRKRSLITGFAKIPKSKFFLRSAIKLFVFFICTAGFFYHTWTFLQLYLEYPTIQVTSEDYPETFSAPAITICNRNRLFRQRFCKTYPKECGGQNISWVDFCDRYRKQCPSTRSKPQEFNCGMTLRSSRILTDRSKELLNDVGPQKESDIIRRCYVKEIGGSRECNSSIMIQAANTGLPYKCVSFFSLLGKQNEESEKITFNDYYDILLEMHPEEYINNNDLVQASVSVHDPRKVVNPLTEGVTLATGKSYTLYPSMEQRESLPPPYASKCMDYMKVWKKNGGHGPLSKKDCTDLCKIKAMIDEYGCVGQTATYPNNYTICNSTRIVASAEMNRMCTSTCRTACEENIYHLTVETAENYNKLCKDPMDEYCKYKDMVIRVRFNEMMVEKFQQVPRFESIELFSYIGGYLGMWLGISLASAFDFAEMIYDVIAFQRRKRNQKTTTPTVQTRHQTVVKKQKRKKKTIRMRKFHWKSC